jgi:hypothetical protein
MAVPVAVASLNWKPYPVCAPDKSKAIAPDVPTVVPKLPVEADDKYSRLPVRVAPLVGPVIDKPFPVVRAVVDNASPIPVVVESAARLRAPLALFVGEVIITLPVVAVVPPARVTILISPDVKPDEPA